MVIEPRSVTALIGPSGCGKSTFLRSLNRMHEVIVGARVEGTVLLDGVDLYGAEVDPVAVRRKVGMVFQRPNPFPTMSIYDNVLAGKRLNSKRLKKAEADALVEQSLRGANLWEEVKDRLARPGSEPLRRSAAAAVHRPGDRRRARGAADGRAVLGARPDLDAGDRGADEGAAGDVHDRDRDPQHAAGGPGSATAPRSSASRAPASPASWSRWTTPRRSSPTPAGRRPSTTSRGGSGDRRT